LKQIEGALKDYDSLSGACGFFHELGYPIIDPPVPFDVSELPEGARKAIVSLHQLVNLDTDSSTFRVFHAQLADSTIRRTDIRRFLEAFYRHYPQGENLFVFSPEENFDELAFVSPVRLPDPRGGFVYGSASYRSRGNSPTARTSRCSAESGPTASVTRKKSGNATGRPSASRGSRNGSSRTTGRYSAS